ncbi:MAG: hypothetical protein K2Q22_14230 [Cytophagales bacterium]|nr:hypothetical protein [Cytophagales bacterium]
MGELKRSWMISRLKAATLIEIMVALLIISIVFTITLNILLKVSQSGYTLSKIKAIQEIKRTSFKTKNERRFIPEELHLEGFVIKKNIKPYPTDTALLELSIAAYSMEGKLIYQQKEIVKPREE